MSHPKIGDYVMTPTGKRGTIMPPPWPMPRHVILFTDDGYISWFLAEILTVLEQPHV